MFALIYFDMGTRFYMFEQQQKMKIFTILYTKYMENCEGCREQPLLERYA